MANSLRNKIKHLCYKGYLSESERDRLLNALDADRIKTELEPSWIPCSERLPVRDVDVLTYHRNESFDYQYVSWIDESTGKWAGFIGNLHDEVIAWMPLPQPYSESEE